MEIRQKHLQICGAVIGCALLLRLVLPGQAGSALRLLTGPEATSAMLYLHTGRVIRPVTVTDTAPSLPEPTVPAGSFLPEGEELDTRAAFSREDADLVELINFSGQTVDIPALLTQPLYWDLTGEGPTVLILHTHATESYVNFQDYRSLDPDYNMVSVGNRLAELLESRGIGVIHHTAYHDQPSYNAAYEQSRMTIKDQLAKHPTIRLVLDLHRDAVTDQDGRQLAYTLQTPKGTAARMMLVMGSGSGGLRHPNWQENLSVAVKLQAQLEKNTPGICRPVALRASRYNQDLDPGVLLIEMGAAGNTRQQALLAAEFLADAIFDLANGAAGMQNAECKIDSGGCGL